MSDQRVRFEVRQAPNDAFPFSVLHCEQDGIPTAIYQPSESERPTPSRAEGTAFLDLFERMLERTRPDLLLTYGGHWLAREMIRRANERRVRVVFWLRNFAYRDAALFRQTDAIIVPSEFSREHYRRNLGIECAVVPSPIDWDQVRCKPDPVVDMSRSSIRSRPRVFSSSHGLPSSWAGRGPTFRCLWSRAAGRAASGGGAHTTSDGSFGTLLKNDGSYTLTGKHGEKTEFNAAGLMIARFDRNGNRTSLSYTDWDGDGVSDELYQVADPFGRTKTFTYTAGLLSSTTDFAGRVTSYGYDASGRLTKITGADPDGAGPETGEVTTCSYDTATNLLTGITDHHNRTTAIAYNHALRAEKVTHHDGTSWELAPIHTKGVVDTSTGAGTIANPAPISLPEHAVGEYTNESGNLVAFRTDRLGYATEQTSGEGHTTQFGTVRVNQELTPNDFNDAGVGWEDLGEFTISGDTLVVKLSDDANEYVIADAIRIERLDPTYTTTYDAVGNVLTETDPLGHTTTHAYDNLGRLTSTADARSGVTRFSYDLAGRLTSLTDPVNNTTSWVYDNIGRLTSETNQLNLTRTYAWDPVGNLTKLTDRNGRVREFVYDGLDRRTQEKWLSGTSVVNTIDYVYDDADQLSSVSDADSAYSYTYDALGRTKTVDNAGTAGVPNVVLTATYDAAGHRTGLDATVGGTADFSNRYTMRWGA